MINIIGACIVTLLLLALASQRPSLSRVEKNMSEAPFTLHVCLLLLFFFLLIDVAFPNSLSFWPLQALNFLLTGLTLWIHEAGHVYWGWDGQLLHSFGGTLNELLFSLLPALYCYRQQHVLLSLVFLYWFGHLSFGIARYIGDARSQAIPLLGGGTHDWHYILGEVGLLEYDKTLGTLMWWIGLVVAITALVLYTRHTFSLKNK